MDEFKFIQSMNQSKNNHLQARPMVVNGIKFNA